MENNDKKFDELVGLVKNNATAIGDLAVLVKNNTEAIDELAVMVKNGFDAVDHRFDKVEKDIDILKIDVKSIKNSMVHDFQHNALEQRVGSLELKVKSA